MPGTFSFGDLPEANVPKLGEILMVHDSSVDDPATDGHELVLPDELERRNQGKARKGERCQAQ